MLKTLILTTVGAAVIVLGVVTQSEAAQVVAPVSASTDMGEWFGSPLEQSFNQYGLLVGYTSGVTDFDSYLSQNPRHYGFWGKTSWLSNGTITGSITFDLGDVFNLEGMAFWNDLTIIGKVGVSEFNLFSSLTGESDSFTNLGSFNPNIMMFGFSRPQVFNFNTTAQFIRMDIRKNYGNPTFTGIGEVAFNAAPAQEPVDNVPEPLSILGSATALGFGVLFNQKTSRRQKNQPQSPS